MPFESRSFGENAETEMLRVQGHTGRFSKIEIWVRIACLYQWYLRSHPQDVVAPQNVFSFQFFQFTHGCEYSR